MQSPYGFIRHQPPVSKAGEIQPDGLNDPRRVCVSCMQPGYTLLLVCKYFNTFVQWFARSFALNEKSQSQHLRLALTSILNCRFGQFMALFGLVCKSYVHVSSGTHKRTPWNALGDTSVEMVFCGNILTSVTFSVIEHPPNWWDMFHLFWGDLVASVLTWFTTCIYVEVVLKVCANLYT